MIPIKSITINRAEGRIEYCKKHEFNSMKDVDHHMIWHSDTYPKMGYDKHDVTVLWEDGTKYNFRLDAMHPENKYHRSLSENTVSYHIERSIRYYLNPENKNSNPDSIIFFKHVSQNLEV
jgi:hypothetical protein